MLLLSVQLLPNQAEEVKERVESQWTFPLRHSILLAVYAFVSTPSRSMNSDANDVGMVGMLLVALVVLVCNITLFDKFDAHMFYMATPPLIVSEFLLISFFQGFDGIGNTFINAGFSSFVILTLIVLAACLLSKFALLLSKFAQ